MADEFASRSDRGDQKLTLSLANVRALLLAAQGLAALPAHKATKADVLATIRQMGLLQLDTISVVARSHYLVLCSRLGAGGGLDCFLAARTVGPSGHVIGVDMTAEMIEKARLNQAKMGLSNVEFRLGEIEHLPAGDARKSWAGK